MTTATIGSGLPHRRFNQLTGEWTLVSPHRTSRPWQGRVEDRAEDNRPTYDPTCYLCPGNERAAGRSNPAYEGVHVFSNDFPALLAESETPESAHPLFQADAVTGECRVVCFSERHDLELTDMSVPEVRAVIDMWAGESTRLFEDLDNVLVFQNRGAQMGASNPHPHGQIWATSQVTTNVAIEAARQSQHFEAEGTHLLLDYADAEREAETRVVAVHGAWMAVVPWWATWPFETLVLPCRAVGRLAELSEAERDDLAGLLKSLLASYDALFDAPCPYGMGWHQRPNGESTGWTLHAHFNPPVLRSASVRKFMASFEMFGEPARDLTPEAAAARIRDRVLSGAG